METIFGCLKSRRIDISLSNCARFVSEMMCFFLSMILIARLSPVLLFIPIRTSLKLPDPSWIYSSVTLLQNYSYRTHLSTKLVNSSEFWGVVWRTSNISKYVYASLFIWSGISSWTTKRYRITMTDKHCLRFGDSINKINKKYVSDDTWFLPTKVAFTKVPLVLQSFTVTVISPPSSWEGWRGPAWRVRDIIQCVPLIFLSLKRTWQSLCRPMSILSWTRSILSTKEGFKETNSPHAASFSDSKGYKKNRVNGLQQHLKEIETLLSDNWVICWVGVSSYSSWMDDSSWLYSLTSSFISKKQV